MSVKQTVPYISLKDQVVATLDGYALRFVAGEVVDVPNFKNVIAAVQAAGCVPAEEVGAQVRDKITKTKTVEEHNAETAEERSAKIQMAILAIVHDSEPANFTRNGSPQTRALEQIAGIENIKNAERDAEWKKYLATKGE